MTLKDLIIELNYYCKPISDEEVLRKLKDLVRHGVTAKDIDSYVYESGIDGKENLLCVVCDKKHVKTLRYLINIGCK